MPRIVHTNLASLAERTTDGQTSDLMIAGAANARFLLAVTALSGPTSELEVAVEGKTKSGSYVVLGLFRKLSTIDAQSIEITRLMPTYRIKWKIRGPMAKFTFEVDALIETEI